MFEQELRDGQKGEWLGKSDALGTRKKNKTCTLRAQKTGQSWLHNVTFLDPGIQCQYEPLTVVNQFVLEISQDGSPTNALGVWRLSSAT